VYTPPEDTILRGITRATVMEICEELGIPVEEKRITLGELYAADEVFLTGTAAEVAPVRKVDGRKIGEECPGPITRRIMEAFRELTKKEGTPVYEE
jgi:branched-chain amino acid aminotransferase